jgi:hypothetical protein
MRWRILVCWTLATIIFFCVALTAAAQTPQRPPATRPEALRAPNQPESRPAAPAPHSPEADRAMMQVVQRLATGAGHAHTCGLDRVAQAFAAQADALLMLHAVSPVIGPRGVPWQEPFNFFVASGRSLALSVGCRSEEWTNDWREVRNMLDRTRFPMREEADRQALSEAKMRFIIFQAPN